MEMVIRDFVSADQAEARAIIQDGLAERWGSGFDPAANPDTDDLYGHYVDSGGELLVAVVDNTLVGVGALVDEADGVGRIVRLSVSSAHRRLGVASALITELVDRARQRRCHAVMVSTDTPWTDAVALYEANGFSVIESDPADTVLWLDLVWTAEVLATDRLELKAPTADDNAFVAELLTDVATRSYLGGPASFAVIEWVKSHSLAPQWGSFVVWLKDPLDRPADQASFRPDPLGQRIGMVELENWRGDLEMSCHLLPEFWGHGYATESSRAVLDWVWSHRDEASIVAVTHAENDAAIAGLRHLGFVREEQVEEWDELHERWRLGRPTG